MTAERIEGEFHYATVERRSGGDWRIQYVRHGTAEFLAVTDSSSSQAVANDIAHAKLARLDREARHFIQQGREAALAEVDAAADFGFFEFSQEGPGRVLIEAEWDRDAEKFLTQITGESLTAALLNDGEAG